MDFNHYFTNDELASTLQEWTQTYSQLAALSTLGSSHEKRPIWLLILTNQESGSDTEKPAIWLDGNLHATELTGTTAVLHFAHHLLQGYAQGDPQAKRLLDTCTFYLAPRLNPDGSAAAMSPNPRYLRSSVRLYPYEEVSDGLHQEDIDGDGRILQMRIPDPNGSWKISALDPRLMEKRAPYESGGSYYRLLTEGRIENYDGYTIEEGRPPQGLDFNRNFPFEWRSESEQHGAGPYPASEPEVRAVVDFISRHLNINAAITFHTFSRVLLRPFSTRPDDSMEVGDLWLFKKIGEIGSKFSGYRCVSTFHDFKYHPKEITTGAFDDWMYDQFGAFTFTIELWDLPTEAGIVDRKFIDWWREHPHEEDLKILKWADEHAPGSFVSWYPIEHPQLGHLELGGWDQLFTWSNPPLPFVESEVARHTPFVLSMAEMLPHLSIHTLEASPVGENAYRINLVIENTGFFSTSTSQQGRKRRVVRPVRVELVLPEHAHLASGNKRTELGHLEGRSADLSVTANGASDPTNHRRRLEWVVRAPQGSNLTFKIVSERAGTVVRSLLLE